MGKPMTARAMTLSASKCFESFRAAGRRSCGGCHLERYCQMPKLAHQWMSKFLREADPGGDIVTIRLGGLND